MPGCRSGSAWLKVGANVRERAPASLGENPSEEATQSSVMTKLAWGALSCWATTKLASGHCVRVATDSWEVPCIDCKGRETPKSLTLTCLPLLAPPAPLQNAALLSSSSPLSLSLRRAQAPASRPLRGHAQGQPPPHPHLERREEPGVISTLYQPVQESVKHTHIPQHLSSAHPHPAWSRLVSYH